MLENSKLPENPSTATSNQNNEEVAGGGGPASVGFEEEDRAGLEEGYRNWAGNRWPRQETLALLKIRSDMDAEFKEASIKVPLWEEVSRSVCFLLLTWIYAFSGKSARKMFICFPRK